MLAWFVWLWSVAARESRLLSAQGRGQLLKACVPVLFDGRGRRLRHEGAGGLSRPNVSVPVVSGGFDRRSLCGATRMNLGILRVIKHRRRLPRAVFQGPDKGASGSHSREFSHKE